MPRHGDDDDSYLIGKYGDADREDDRGQIFPRTTRSQRPTQEKQAPHTSAAMSGAATEADIKKHNDPDRANLK